MRRHPWLASLTCSVALFAASALLAPGSATAAAAAKTCNGRPVTLLGQPGVAMLATAGDDVIFTRGAPSVDTGAGNDSICITGAGDVTVNAGPGDDFVGARKHEGRSYVSLGFGNDVFFGGDGDDRVWSQESYNQTALTDRDRISTGGGSDYVISGSTLASNYDYVDLGTGNDSLLTYGDGPNAALSGGPGRNSLRPAFSNQGDWEFNNVSGTATRYGYTQLTWQNFTNFDLTSANGAVLEFLGSSADEVVQAGGSCAITLNGEGGNDRLLVGPRGCDGLLAGDAHIYGGFGNDRLTGAMGNDFLSGGPGNDVATGNRGTDLCRAEVRRSCEST